MNKSLEMSLILRYQAYKRFQAARREFIAKSKSLRDKKARILMSATPRFFVASNGSLDMDMQLTQEQERDLALIDKEINILRDRVYRRNGLNPQDYPV